MDQRTVHESYWRRNHSASYPQLRSNITIDVAIIGGGVTGLTAAYLLQRSGLKVVVLEKDTIGSGTTGHTTGKVTSQHNLVYSDLRQRLGDKIAYWYGQANEAAIRRIDSIISDESIKCGWQRRDNYVFTCKPDEITTFEQEAKTATDMGLPATFVADTPLPFSVEAAVKFSEQATIDSQQYIEGLAKAINSRSGHIYENTKATFILDGYPGMIHTPQANVKAHNIIIATNVPTFPLAARGTYCFFEYPQQTYVVAGEPQLDVRGMYISPDSHHYSILPVSKELLLVSGEGHLPGMGGSKEKRYQRLAEYANRHFGVSHIQYRWEARDYLSYDSLPLVGKLYPWSRSLYVATAFKKWGLTNGTAAAELLRDLIMGTDNPWATVYTSHRFRVMASIPHTITKSF